MKAPAKLSVTAKRRSALLALPMLSLMLATAGCATDDGSHQIVLSSGKVGHAHLSEASAKDGDPMIVASPVSVQVGLYSEMTSDKGARLGRKDILGWAVMPRDVYFDIMAERAASLESVKRAHERAAKAEAGNAVRDELARACGANSLCRAEAAPTIARIIGAVK